MPNHPLRSNSSQFSNTGDLFNGTVAQWTEAPEVAFDAWLERHGFASSSKASYRSLWVRYLEWLNRNRIRLDRADSAHIKSFLGALQDVRVEQRERYHRLIERAYHDLMGQSAGDTNPASLAKVPFKEEWRDAPSNDDTEFLDRDEREKTIKWTLSKEAPTISRPTSLAQAKGRAPAAWRHVRDRAIVASVLGCGVKLSEVIHQSVQGVHYVGRRMWLMIEPAANEPRNVQLEHFATVCVADWLRIRESAPPASELLFPAAGDGRSLDVRTVRRIFTNFFEGIGTDVAYTPQLLRNSFAAMLFGRGTDLEEVQRAMGYRRDLSAKRMYEAWSHGQSSS